VPLPHPIDESTFASEAVLGEWCARIGGAGYRGTGTKAHERVIAWVEEELAAVPGLVVRTDPFDVLRWEPAPEGDLERAASLTAGGQSVEVAGAVPYSAPAEVVGPIVHLPAGEPITAEVAAGKVVLRDFPQFPLPYDALLGLALHRTPDTDQLSGQVWDRPGLADTVLHEDLLAAGAAGAAGVVIAFDLPREQVAGYHEPHKGTHYRVPACFVGVEGREQLRAPAAEGATVELTVTAEVGAVSTRNVHATLPGQSSERIVIVTHTDGNTWVQENGIAALLGLARHFAGVPIEQRQRTIEFAFTTAHLHISREGAARYAARLDEEYDTGDVVFAFPVEHLGARALEPVAPDDGGPGRQLDFSGVAEPLLWCVGPSDPLRRAVTEAVARRALDQVLVLPGFGAPAEDRVPSILSFGGLGTLFNMHLVPTTSIITGPWSLWAPAFGGDAIDVAALRRQALAAGDVITALDGVPRDEIAGGYLTERAARAAGTTWVIDDVPPELAPS
jgi:hypothetical protein